MLSLESVIDAYLKYALHKQGVAKTTYKSYHAYLGRFHRFLVTCPRYFSPVVELDSGVL